MSAERQGNRSGTSLGDAALARPAFPKIFRLPVLVPLIVLVIVIVLVPLIVLVLVLVIVPRCSLLEICPRHSPYFRSSLLPFFPSSVLPFFRFSAAALAWPGSTHYKEARRWIGDLCRWDSLAWGVSVEQLLTVWPLAHYCCGSPQPAQLVRQTSCTRLTTTNRGARMPMHWVPTDRRTRSGGGKVLPASTATIPSSEDNPWSLPDPRRWNWDW